MTIPMREDPAKLTDENVILQADLGLVDSPSEEVFDRGVRLASRLVGAPVSLLSFVDGTRQFFKAQKGLAEPWATLRETPLSHSFCQHVVSSDAPLIVEDARKDEMLKDNLAIPDLGVVAYLGVPVRHPSGAVLGSFCAIDSQPRQWTEEDRALMTDLADGISNEIKLRAALLEKERLRQESQQMKNRLDLAITAGRLGVFDLDLETGESQWDSMLFDLWGMPKTEANPFPLAMQMLHPDDLPAHEEEFEKAKTPGGDGLYSMNLRVRVPGEVSSRVLHAQGKVSFEGETPKRMVGAVQDVSELWNALEQQRLLTKELNHRVKNLFAITAGLISITAQESKDCKEMADALRSRILSLSAAHDLVRPAIVGEETPDTEAELDGLVKTIISPHLRLPEQLQSNGAAISIAPDLASSFALLLHELATNAGKYGALSHIDGRLNVSWTHQGDTLHIHWNETCAAGALQKPVDEGFGSTLIDMTVRRKLRGEYELDWKPDGLSVTVRLPWKQ
ncbi:GAF domain-containing protein [Aliishimia ponticola]|uniref:histidine kinase n=1 Tax=Aliishimia ponticola TaxID=2499833 RepID=A0A4S4NH22_9RHOB|nr:GAF domain-containing protein [Aliishimia ponticola]THH38135.1 GAF domain-containing protein [Aliishimia ponticola]